MRRNLLGATIGFVAGGAIGALFAAVSLLAEPSLSADCLWLLGLNAGIGAYAGLLIGGLSANTQAAIGGSLSRCVAAVGLCLAVGAAVPQHLCALNPGGMQLLFAAVGALAGAGSMRWLHRFGKSGASCGAAPSRRRWFQFNLGTLLAMVFAASAALAVFVSGPLEQRRIVKRVVERGGRVQYGTTAPGWVLDLLGRESRGWFDSVTELQCVAAADGDIPRFKRLPHLRRLGLGGEEVTDEGLNRLAPMNGLESLSLFGLPSVGDAGLECLAGLENVQELWLGDLKISDAGLQQLKKMPRLRKLWLYNLSITDAGLAAIEDLADLELLSLQDMPNLSDAGLKSLSRLARLKELELLKVNVTDAGLVHLKSVKKLEHLSLVMTNVTGAGFEQLEPLASLRWVRLSRSPINDQGLRAIARFGQIRTLELAGTAITDEGLSSVGEMKDLEFLSFTDTAVTDAGLQHLKALKRLTGYFHAGSKVTEAAVERLRAEMQVGLQVP